MKTKLSAQEKARRQDWRDKRYASPAIPRPHHLTNAERKASAKQHKATMTAPEYFNLLFGPVEALVNPTKKKYLKMRARKKHTAK